MNDAHEKIREALGLGKSEELRIETKRMPWDHTFLQMAVNTAARSHDPQTQNGCVLVRDNTILSTGYNGFIRNIDDTALPNLRPYKYPFMIHAEHNAILNCARNGISTLGATSYQTGMPCVPCLQFMWQAGIDRIVYTDYSQNVMCNEEMDRVREALLMLINPEIKVYDDFALPQAHIEKRTRLDMRFIPFSSITP
jgi:dCMP deaminase